MRKNEFDFALELFIEIAVRWVEDLLRFVDGKITSMDRKAVEKLLAKQKLS